MSSQLVECVPNFSEGRRTEIIDAIVSAITGVSGVTLLGRTSDSDHNRSVITFAGPPEPVAEAAFASIAKSAELINLDEHQGEHPRLGAADVVPFVPLASTSMETCIALAQQLGQRVGETLELPVYLYEEAAARPDRVNLADVRRGEYEALKSSIATTPDRAPDFGPAKVGPAGAVIIGARAPLIAYNVYLNTDDVKTAQRIARAIRERSGGFRYVKALGLLVEGQAQVSMNITNYRRSPVYRVTEAIRREAERYGTTISHTEIVGLVPQNALFNAARWYLQLKDFTSKQAVEIKLNEAAAVEDESSFLENLAAQTPTPGGGSAAAYSGAMAAALVAMVARGTASKKQYADVKDRMNAIAAEADSLRGSLKAAVSLDADAFNGVMNAFKQPKETAEQKAARAQAIEQATQRAAQVPLEAAGMAVQVLSLAAEATELGNVNAITDAASAGALARAALNAAVMNVKINAQGLSDRDAVNEWLTEITNLEAQAQQSETRIQHALRERAELE